MDEMIDDIKAYDEAKADEGEYFPSQVVHAIARGENSIKVLRQYRKMTQEKLAKKAQISRAYLAQIETGKKLGSVTSLKKIAESLKVDLDDIT